MTGSRGRALHTSGFRVSIVLACLVAALASSSCTTSNSASVANSFPSKSVVLSSNGTARGLGGLPQTWPKDYGLTTCSDWLTKMDQSQRQATGADLLIQLRYVQGGVTKRPSDPLIASFGDNLSAACKSIPESAIIDEAGFVYLLATDTWKA